MNCFPKLGALVVMISMVACQSEHNENHHEQGVFQVTTPLKIDTSVTQEYVCQIHSGQHIELRALEGGYVENIYVDEGQFVHKGQMMFQIMPRLYQAEYQKALAEANFADIEFKNIKSLADSNIVSPNELALAKAELDKANAELALAETKLSFTEIKAPFDGLMDHFHVRLGSLVEEGELLTTLSDNKEMWVYFNVPEAEYLDYKSEVNKKEQLPVQLLMANNKVFQHEGRITTIEADFNNETGNIAFRANFPNPEGLLRHGETGNILMKMPYKEALLIPQKTTFEIMDKIFVFVIDENNTVTTRQIRIDAELPHLYIVGSGLKEGDKVLLEGIRKVRANDKIDIELKDPKEVISHLDLYAE